MRFEETLVFQTLQRGVNGTDRMLAIGSFHELAANFKAVGIVAEARDGEQRGEFEATRERRRARSLHKYHYVEQIADAQGKSSWRIGAASTNARGVALERCSNRLAPSRSTLADQ